MKERGFTLIEVLITMVVVAVMLLGLLQMWLVTYSYNRDSERRIDASAAAQAMLADASAMIHAAGGEPAQIAACNTLQADWQTRIDNNSYIIDPYTTGNRKYLRDDYQEIMRCVPLAGNLRFMITAQLLRKGSVAAQRQIVITTFVPAN